MRASVTHIAGNRLNIEGRIIQRCALCGAPMCDSLNVALPLNPDGSALEFHTWPVGRQVRVTTGQPTAWHLLEDTEKLVPDSCLTTMDPLRPVVFRSRDGVELREGDKVLAWRRETHHPMYVDGWGRDLPRPVESVEPVVTDVSVRGEIVLVRSRGCYVVRPADITADVWLARRASARPLWEYTGFDIIDYG